MANEDKEKIYNLTKYDEELEMLEDWLTNPRIDKNVCLMLGCSIGKEHIEGRNIELSCKLVDSSREPREQQQFQNKKMQVYHPRDMLDMEID